MWVKFDYNKLQLIVLKLYSTQHFHLEIIFIELTHQSYSDFTLLTENSSMSDAKLWG